jgi:hypothetical protein
VSGSVLPPLAGATIVLESESFQVCYCFVSASTSEFFFNFKGNVCRDSLGLGSTDIMIST